MLNMIFNFDDFKHSENIFAEFATVVGYPNLRASDIDKYQGLVNFENVRTGQTIFQGYDGIYIEFDKDESLIRFYSDANKRTVLFTYKELITKLTEAKNAEDNVFNAYKKLKKAWYLVNTYKMQKLFNDLEWKEKWVTAGILSPWPKVNGYFYNIDVSERFLEHLRDTNPDFGKLN